MKRRARAACGFTPCGVSTTDVGLEVDVDVQLEDDITLAWIAAYLDGLPVALTPGATVAMTPGAHKLTVEVYLQPRLRNELGGAVRMDAAITIGLPRPRAGRNGLAAGALVLLRDRGGAGEIADRVQTTTELRPPAEPPTGTAAPEHPPLDLIRKLAIDEARRHATRRPLPATFTRPGTKLGGMFDICVDRDGVVEWVHTRRSTGHPVVDAIWKSDMRSWLYRPYRVDGQARSFCLLHGFSAVFN
jgi:hypothetical protein